MNSGIARAHEAANREADARGWDPVAVNGMLQEVEESTATLLPAAELKEMDSRELCRLCYGHLQGRDCWSKDKVPNCGVDGCEAANHPLLHSALVEGRVMVVQGISGEKVQVFLCREDVCVEGAGKAGHLHTLYDWGATVTLVPQATAEKAGLKRVRQPAAAIAGLGGRCTMVDSLHGAGRRQRRQGAERESPGRRSHHSLDGHGRAD